MSCAAADGGFIEPEPPACSGLACQVAHCDMGAQTLIRGQVTTPNGMDPVSQALVYVPESGELSPLSAALGCELCSNPFSGRPVVFTYSDRQGRFELRGAPAGDSIPIVVQKGRFRRLVRMPVAPCVAQDAAVPGSRLALPRSRSEGDLPQMAVAAGDHDAIECVLRDLGLDAGEFTASDGDLHGAVHLYDNQTPGAPALPGQLPLTALLRDRDRLFRYHVVFLNCSGTAYAQTLLADATVRANLRDYVASGGRLYVTDWSYDFIQQLPEMAPFICFADGQDCTLTSPHAFHSAVAYGGDGTPLSASVDQSTEFGRALADWLTELPAPAHIPPDNVPIEDLLPGWVMVQQTALDPGRYPTTVWLKAPVDGRTRPLTLSFDYPPQAACGRVLFSSYHTRERLPGLLFPAYCPFSVGGALAQERVLEFLLFELNGCLGSPG